MAKRKMPSEEKEKRVVTETPSVKPVVEQMHVLDIFPKRVVEKCYHLNVREEPNKNGKILFDVPAGTVLSVDPNFVDNEWIKIALYNEYPREGYVMKSFTKELKDD